MARATTLAAMHRALAFSCVAAFVVTSCAPPASTGCRDNTECAAPLVCVAGACAPMPPRTEVSADDFCARAADVICAGQADCCPMPPTDHAACLEAARTHCETTFAPLLHDPRTGYDPAVAASVIARGAALAGACDPAVLAWLQASDGLFSVLTGTVAGGGVCATGGGDVVALFSCESPMACLPAPGGPTHFCVAHASSGQSCEIDASCADGLFCSTGVCAARRASGDACSVNVQCASGLCAAGRCAVPTVQAVYCAPP